jgi:hypothetical protein
MELATSVALGVCLSAACGFRVFAPLLVLSVAGLSGYFTPAENLAWIATWPALALFATATVVEILAYYVPWADNALDAIATPAALLAGAVAAASVFGDLPTSWQWFLAAVAGGGSAGLVQAGTVVLRGTSSVTTGGAGNFVVATIENFLSFATAILALIVPLILAVALVAGGLFVWRWKSRSSAPPRNRT